MEGLLPHFADAGNDTNFGTSMTLTALRSYLDSKGVDSQKWWLDVQTAILQVRSVSHVPLLALPTACRNHDQCHVQPCLCFRDSCCNRCEAVP